MFILNCVVLACGKVNFVKTKFEYGFLVVVANPISQRFPLNRSGHLHVFDVVLQIPPLRHPSGHGFIFAILY
jgi:hypothetical protein